MPGWQCKVWVTIVTSQRDDYKQNCMIRHLGEKNKKDMEVKCVFSPHIQAVHRRANKDQLSGFCINNLHSMEP